MAHVGDLSQVPLPGDDTTSPDESAPVIEAFAPRVAQGPSPFSTTLDWRVQSPVGEALTCTLDFEGDGTVDETITGCSEGSLAHTYAGLGRYMPVLSVVDESQREAQAVEIVYSNRLELAANVHVVRNLAGLLSVGHDDATVTLEFEDAAGATDIQVGDILFEGMAPSFIREVTAVEVQGATVVFSTVPRTLFDAFSSGFWGVREPSVVMTDESGQVIEASRRTPGANDIARFVRTLGPAGIPIPVGSTHRFGIGDNMSLTFSDTNLTLNLYTGYVELDVGLGYLAVYVDAETVLSAHAELVASVSGTKRWVLPVPYLSYAVDAGPFQLAVGLVLEPGVTFDGTASLTSDLRLAGRGAADVFVGSPIIREVWPGYPDDRYRVSPQVSSQVQNTTVSAEAVITAFIEPKLTLTVGDTGDGCGTGFGAEATLGVETGVRATANGQVSAEGTELCGDITAYATAYAKLVTGMDILCGEWPDPRPRREVSLWNDCYDSTWVPTAGAAGSAGAGFGGTSGGADSAGGMAGASWGTGGVTGSAGTTSGTGGASGGTGGTVHGGASGAEGNITGGAGGAGGTGSIIYGIPGQSCESLDPTLCQGESCCTTILVPGGTFMMGRSEVSTDADYYSSGSSSEVPEHAVTVDSYYLEKYEVTVGRFRAFVEQYDGTPPAVGAGAHPSIPGTGWDSAWDDALPATQADLMANLKCPGWDFETWTDTADANEAYAINCVSWYAAQAFCVWDGARLPTEAEWEYAAAGGTENRLYPWGSAAPDATLANYVDSDYTVFLAVGSKPLGAGRWGHQDLAGGMWEWAFDWYDGSWYGNASASGQNPCNIATAFLRVVRGGSWDDDDFYLRAAGRLYSGDPDLDTIPVGLRCARTP